MHYNSMSMELYLHHTKFPEEVAILSLALSPVQGACGELIGLS